ncbi:O-antigen ligase family protein, partial [bacterium]|nr:O-antigen ligase family protein [bacterium]
MKYALKVYYLIPLAALLFSNQFHQKFFILKDFFLILMLPVLITGILYRIFVKAENSNEIVITVSDFLIISAFALVTLHYFSLKKYLDTIISFHHMQFLLLLFISIKFIPFELKSDNGKIVFVLSGIIISVITIVEKINYPGSRLLYQSTFGNPSYSSGFLLLLFPVMMSLTNKVLKNIIVIIASIAIIILGSRVAIVILCFQFFVLLRGKRKQAVFFVIAIITLFMIFNSNRMKLNSKSFRRNMVYRVEVLKTSVKMLPDSIILGRGNSYAKYNFHKYYEKLRNRKVSYLNTYYLHCDPLEFIIEYGWLFFVICLFVLLLCIKTPEFITVSVISLI